jgi:hypothetical protein
MEKQAAAALGEPVMDGVILLARGAAKEIRKNVAPSALGGLTGSLSRVAVDKMTKDTTPTGNVVRQDQGRGAFLGLTASHLVLFVTEDGRFRQKLGEQIASFNPGDVDRFEFGKAAAGVGTLDIVSVNGERWCYEYSKMVSKKLVRMAEATRALVVEVD